MHRLPFVHFLPLLIIVVVASTGVIVLAIRLLFRRKQGPLDI